ncbi:MAG: hypothetical protein FWB97_04530 [Oscillospiraceae bacterium]|nr:hypothetical protein [Oscillospiraceae bacterium]
MTRFVCRNIARARAKSMLASAVALFFAIALAFLIEAINRVGTEIDYMYDNIRVTAEIRQLDPLDSALGRQFGEIIRPRAVEGITGSGFAQNEFVKSVHRWAVITPEGKGGALCDNWYDHWLDSAGDDGSRAPISETDVNGFVAVNDLDLFLAARSGNLVNQMLTLDWLMDYFDFDKGGIDWEMVAQTERGDLEIEFAPGFGTSDFVFSVGDPIPVIISGYTMEKRSLPLGGTAFLSALDPGHMGNFHLHVNFTHGPALIIGTHNNRNLHTPHFRDGIIMPLDAMMDFLGPISRVRVYEWGFTDFAFEIAPAHNREILYVRERLEEIVRQRNAGWVPLSLMMHDEELRVVVGSMEQNLSFLRLLYPVAVIVSMAVGFGLSVLLIMQNAKNAAIMRVMGVSRRRTQAVLCIEQLGVCVSGLALGLAVPPMFGWSIGAAVMLAGLYLLGTAAGSAAGAALVTNRPPLELLQVKE